MDARRTRRQALRRGSSLLVALLVAGLVQSTSALAASQAAVASATASPAAFVPDWDGHTDSTVIEYRLVERSDVNIRVLDARGRVVQSIHVGARDAGMHEASWDGRARTGAVQAPGVYRIRIDARPLRRPVAPAAGQPGAAAMGGPTVAVAGARATTVTLQRSDVTVTAVQLDRATIGARGARASTTAKFLLSTPATVSAAIVDANGGVLRTLATGRMRSGANTVAWDGRATGGALVRDGNYSLVLAATGGGRPTGTTRLPLTVDRSAPTLTASTAVRATVAADSRISIPLQVTAGEQASIVVRLGRRVHRASLTAGPHALRISGDDLGLRATKGARTARVLVTAVDAAGNVSTARITISIPPRSRTARPAPPAPKPGTQTPVSPITPPVGGRWPWPVGGVVTSEFGLREGRLHAGLDIAVPTGTPIHPIAPGTIAFVGAMSGYGNTVDVRHANGMLTRYAHMSRFGGFAVGAAVTHTDTIGLVGCTGSCSGPHVHFETRVADTPRDPRGFLTPR